MWPNDVPARFLITLSDVEWRSIMPLDGEFHCQRAYADIFSTKISAINEGCVLVGKGTHMKQGQRKKKSPYCFVKMGCRYTGCIKYSCMLFEKPVEGQREIIFVVSQNGTILHSDSESFERRQSKTNHGAVPNGVLSDTLNALFNGGFGEEEPAAKCKPAISVASPNDDNDVNEDDSFAEAPSTSKVKIEKPPPKKRLWPFEPPVWPSANHDVSEPSASPAKLLSATDFEDLSDEYFFRSLCARYKNLPRRSKGLTRIKLEQTMFDAEDDADSTDHLAPATTAAGLNHVTSSSGHITTCARPVTSPPKTLATSSLRPFHATGHVTPLVSTAPLLPQPSASAFLQDSKRSSNAAAWRPSLSEQLLSANSVIGEHSFYAYPIGYSSGQN